MNSTIFLIQYRINNGCVGGMRGRHFSKQEHKRLGKIFQTLMSEVKVPKYLP